MEYINIIKPYSKDSAAKVYISSFDSPIGTIIAAADDSYVYMISFDDSKKINRRIQLINEVLTCQFISEKNKILENLEKEVNSYFKGNCKKFTTPIKTIGTEFQKEVWDKLIEIPYGSTQTYGDLAKSLGRSTSHARAIGTTCGANAHILIIPCHRVVASDSMGGFSSGQDRKSWLLLHEKKHMS